jgi:Uri superfamily endonuclease
MLGEDSPTGVYLLRLHVTRPLRVSLGRLRGGRRFAFHRGPYLYVGSALGLRGASCLARRLLRHATRRAGPPQPLQHHLRHAFPAFLPPRAKRLHWHVDYLLDEPAVFLTGALVLRTSCPLESSLAAWLGAKPTTSVPVPGAGASDASGPAHLFGVVPFPHWWPELCRAAAYRFAEAL